MPHTSDNKRFFIELRSGHGRHRFVRRHNSTEHHNKRKHDRPAKPARLSWSLSIETHSSKPQKRRSTKSRDSDSESGSSGTSRAAQAEARSETCRCWRGDGGAVRVDSDGSSLERIWGHLNDDDADAAATASVWGGERTHRVRRRRHGHHRPHNHYHYQHCRCLLHDAVPLLQQHQHQHIYYRPRVDNSQVQNNYSYERRLDDDDPRRDAPKTAGLEALLPDLEKLSLSSEWSPEGREEFSLPPAYSEIYPLSRGAAAERWDCVSGCAFQEEVGRLDDSGECVWH